MWGMEYLNDKNKVIDSLRPLLIEAFVKFYGCDYSSCIANCFEIWNSLTI